jgi:hypothetical protein
MKTSALNDDGAKLVELMVAIVLPGILIAMAILQFRMTK